MKYRNVGKAGIKVSEIALGSWMTDLKESSEEDVAKEVVKLAYENGINFFDCADAYSGGNDRGLSRKHIMENCEQSLKNMNLDYLDLYYCHRYDENTDLEETLRAMSDLVAQGKVLYYGVSEEWGSARIEEAQKIIDKRGLYPITVIQPQYNMVDRYIEHEIMGTCRKYGIGITSFSPLSQGLLTGKYKKGQPYPEGSRATHQADKQINNLLTDENLAIVDELSKVADDLGTNVAILSLAWILKHPEISCVIAGASKPSQLENNLKAVDLEIPDDAMERIEKILGFQRFERHVG